jgi:hypothetical protein
MKYNFWVLFLNLENLLRGDRLSASSSLRTGPCTSHLAICGIHAVGCSHLTVLSERLALLTPHLVRAAAPMDHLAIYPGAVPPG